MSEKNINMFIKEDSIMYYDDIMQILYDEFSSRICSIDFKNLGTKKECALLCKIDTNIIENLDFLKKYDYPLLIGRILKNFKLNVWVKEECLQFLSYKDIDRIEKEIENVQENLSYMWGNEGLKIPCPEFFVDIVEFPLSQFHFQIIDALDTFTPAIKELGSRVWLDAQSPSFFTQFSQFWVAEKYEMTEPIASNTVVLDAKTISKMVSRLDNKLRRK